MSQYPDLTQRVGIVGRNPETKTTAKGDIVKFSLAVPKQYGQGEGNTEWLDVAVFNEELQPSVMAEVYKGAKVAVEGNLKERVYDGKTYKDFVALRVGLVAWIAKSGTKAKTAPPDSDDDNF